MPTGKPGSNPPRQFVCELCGEHFGRVIFPSYEKKHGLPRFCSIKCRNVANTKRLEVVPCPICGKTFKPYSHTGGRQKYCSVKCTQEATAATKRERRILMEQATRKRYPIEGPDNIAAEFGVTRERIQWIAWKIGATAQHGSNPPQTFICQGCGKRFERIWYPSRKRPQYCSQECRGGKIIVICAFCKKEFKVFPSRSATKYCSRKCADEGGKRPKQICEQCGKEFHTSTKGRRFCCLQCAADYRKATRLHKICETCGKEFIVKKGYTHARFCSHSCSSKAIALRGPDNPNWQGGCSSYRGPNWNEQTDKARKRDNNTCQICELYQIDKKLHVHHIIRFHDFDDYREANKLSNLITLCPICHSKVHNGKRVRDKKGQFIDFD